MTCVCIFNNISPKSHTEQERGWLTKIIIRAGIWSLTINKSQTVFENCSQVVNNILFLKYRQTPPPSLEIRSYRITVKSGRWISQLFMPSNKKVSQIHINRVEEVHRSCNS